MKGSPWFRTRYVDLEDTVLREINEARGLTYVQTLQSQAHSLTYVHLQSGAHRSRERRVTTVTLL